MWVYVPGTSSPSAPGSEDLTSDSSSRLQLLAQSVTWRGKLLQPKSWLRTCKRVGWTQRLSGRISTPSTASHGVRLWIVSLAASRVSRSRVQASDSGQTTNAGSGLSSSESPLNAKFHGSSGRTCREYSPKASEVSLPIWVTQDTEWKRLRESLRLDYSQRKKSALLTEEKESFAWPTPNGSLQNDMERPETWLERSRNLKAKFSMPLSIASMIWPTATTGDAKASGAVSIPTETRHSGTTLTDLAVREGFLNGRQSQEQTGEESQNNTKVLNPRFVEWLMGFPIGWTDLEHSVTGSFQTWQQRHSQF